MKKTIITMLIALVAIFASAETYSYLKFTKTDNTTVAYSTEGLKVTYDASNVIVTNADGTATIALSEVRDMEFTNEAAPAVVRGDVDNNGTVDPADISTLINYLLNGTAVNEANADCDCNGTIDPADISTLINYLLNGMWP